MTQRTLNLTQNNNLPKRCPSKGSFRFNQFRYKKQEKLTMILGKTTLGSKFYAASYYVTKSVRAKHKSSEQLAPLFILQKRSIRLLTGSGYREHTNPLFYRAKCLKLKDIYSLETAKLMYKIHNNVLSFANSDKFNLIKNCYTHKTRLSHKNNFFLPRTRTRLGQKLYHSQELKFGMKFQAV